MSTPQKDVSFQTPYKMFRNPAATSTPEPTEIRRDLNLRAGQSTFTRAQAKALETQEKKDEQLPKYNMGVDFGATKLDITLKQVTGKSDDVVHYFRFNYVFGLKETKEIYVLIDSLPNDKQTCVVFGSQLKTLMQLLHRNDTVVDQKFIPNMTTTDFLGLHNDLLNFHNVAQEYAETDTAKPYEFVLPGNHRLHVTFIEIYAHIVRFVLDLIQDLFGFAVTIHNCHVSIPSGWSERHLNYLVYAFKYGVRYKNELRFFENTLSAYLWYSRHMAPNISLQLSSKKVIIWDMGDLQTDIMVVETAQSRIVSIQRTSLRYVGIFSIVLELMDVMYNRLKKNEVYPEVEGKPDLEDLLRQKVYARCKEILFKEDLTVTFIKTQIKLGKLKLNAVVYTNSILKILEKYLNLMKITLDSLFSNQTESILLLTGRGTRCTAFLNNIIDWASKYNRVYENVTATVEGLLNFDEKSNDVLQTHNMYHGAVFKGTEGVDMPEVKRIVLSKSPMVPVVTYQKKFEIKPGVADVSLNSSKTTTASEEMESWDEESEEEMEGVQAESVTTQKPTTKSKITKRRKRRKQTKPLAGPPKIITKRVGVPPSKSIQDEFGDLQSKLSKSDDSVKAQMLSGITVLPERQKTPDVEIVEAAPTVISYGDLSFDKPPTIEERLSQHQEQLLQQEEEVRRTDRRVLYADTLREKLNATQIERNRQTEMRNAQESRLLAQDIQILTAPIKFKVPTKEIGQRLSNLQYLRRFFNILTPYSKKESWTKFNTLLEDYAKTYPDNNVNEIGYYQVSAMLHRKEIVPPDMMNRFRVDDLYKIMTQQLLNRE